MSKEEREQAAESSFKEVATVVADKCVNPDTQRPYTISQVRFRIVSCSTTLNRYVDQLISKFPFILYNCLSDSPLDDLVQELCALSSMI